MSDIFTTAAPITASVPTAAAETVHDVIVIGSGPAGYTAALYLARADLKPLVFEGFSYGGALMTTTEVENFPGFDDGIMGPELMGKMREQAARFGADLRGNDVESVDLTGEVKSVTVDGEIFKAHSVVLATGSAARYLGLPDEQRLIGRGVSACATCDGFFFRDQDIAVVGGGDSAMEEATFLTKFARSVTIVHRREDFRASPIMLDRARANPKINWALNSAVTAVHGDSKVSGVTLTDTRTGETRELAVTGLFVAIGHDPRSELFKGVVDMDCRGICADGRRHRCRPVDRNQRRRCLRLWRPGRSHLSPGHHRSRFGLCSGARRSAFPVLAPPRGGHRSGTGDR